MKPTPKPTARVSTRIGSCSGDSQSGSIKVLVAEDAAVQQAEQHRHRAGRDAHPGEFSRARRRANGQQQDHRAVADVAEHGAEQQQVGEGERQRRVEFAVARDAIAFHQRHEGRKPARIAHQRGHVGASWAEGSRTSSQ
jgi:hypothetical protein